jgi:hypothetical protein
MNRQSIRTGLLAASSFTWGTALTETPAGVSKVSPPPERYAATEGCAAIDSFHSL